MTSTASPPSPTPLPVLPLRDVVVYPHMVIPLFVGRERSIKALDVAMEGDKQILLVAQKSPEIDDPGRGPVDGRHRRPRCCSCSSCPTAPSRCWSRASRAARSRTTPRPTATCAPTRARSRPAAAATRARSRRHRSSLMALFEQYVKLNRKMPPELLTTLSGIDDPGRLADTVAAHIGIRLQDKQRVLEAVDVAAAPRAADRLRRWRDRRAAAREAHPRPGQVADGEEPARVLPQRADEGDPEGAGRPRRGAQRDGGPRAQVAEAGMPQGGRDQGQGRADQAQEDVADVGRGHGGAQLRRLAGAACRGRSAPRAQGPRRGAEGARRTTTSASRRSRNGSSSTSRCSSASRR